VCLDTRTTQYDL